MHDDTKCMTVKDVMKALRISKQSVYNLKNSGSLPFFKQGKLTRFRYVDVAAYIDAALRDGSQRTQVPPDR